MIERIQRELAILRDGDLVVELIDGSRQFVLYREVPTCGAEFGLPVQEDVLVPVPPGYPASLIDLAGLPIGSPFLQRVRGGQNNQGVVQADGRTWQLASYHPHQNGGGPPWNPMRHGFHTYFDHIVAWLHRLA